MNKSTTRTTEPAPKSVVPGPGMMDRKFANPGRAPAEVPEGDVQPLVGHDFSRVPLRSSAVDRQSTPEATSARAHPWAPERGFEQVGAGFVQADFAVEPKPGTPRIARLSAAEIAAAVTFNQARFTDPDEVALLRDILGLSRTPAEINDEFVRAVVRYQASYGLTQDGQLGPRTVERLSKEVIAEGKVLGTSKLGTLELEFRLRDHLQTMADGGNTTYADYKAAIQGATLVQRNVALLHPDLLTKLRDTLTWNNFARCVELLGRRANTYWEMIGEPIVRAAVRAAWNDSHPAVPGVGTTQHEEGGWVFLNLITGALAARRAAGGAGAAINLTAPPTLTDSIVIAKFHTHPNLGPGWVAGPSNIPPAAPGLHPTGDVPVDAAHGVPDIIAGTNGINPAVFQFFPSGPNRRAHLAGNRGLPGAAGGLAPQAKSRRRR